MQTSLRILGLRRFSCVLIWIVAGGMASAAPLKCDFLQYREAPGLEASAQADNLLVHWDGESGQKLRARLGISAGVPVVQELAIQSPGGTWAVLARELTPEFGVTTGIRRTNHGLARCQQREARCCARLATDQKAKT